MLGIIERYLPSRGYGFLSYLSEGTNETKEVFFHFRDTNRPSRSIYPGAKAEFELSESTKGLKAIRVRIQG